MVRRNKGVHALDTYPLAEITINRNRIRKHGGNTLYMENGTEFEIELDNNTDRKWLTKIKLNGEWISGGGLVLRPGEHVYLERFLDEDRKFLFDTYTVNSDRQEAIKDNGTVEIFFHREQTVWPQVHLNWDFDFLKPRKFGDDSGTWKPWTTTGGSSINFQTSNISYDRGDPILSAHLGDGGRGMSASANKIETGRVEKGSISNQKFVDVNDSFNLNHSHKVSFKILPSSQQQYDIKSVRQYCSCGRRQRKNDNFCPLCGRKY